MTKELEKSLSENLEAEYFKELGSEYGKLLPKKTEQEWYKDFSAPDLTDKLAGLLEEKTELRQEIKNNLLKAYKNVKDEFSIWFGEELVETWKDGRLKLLSREIQKIKWLLSPNTICSKNKITENMKQKARDYPFDQLIKFNRARKAICSFHPDKNPSMSFNPKTNRIRCFACGASFDTIGYVMKVQGISFLEAVKYLNNY